MALGKNPDKTGRWPNTQLRCIKWLTTSYGAFWTTPSLWETLGCKCWHVEFQTELQEKRTNNSLDYINYGKGLEAQFRGPVVCLTSGERRVQLLVEEPLLPVLLLWSDIALCWINDAQRGAGWALGFCRRAQKQRVIVDQQARSRICRLRARLLVWTHAGCAPTHLHADRFEQRITGKWLTGAIFCCNEPHSSRIVRRRNRAAASRLGTESVAHTGSAADCRWYKLCNGIMASITQRCAIGGKTRPSHQSGTVPIKWFVLKPAIHSDPHVRAISVVDKWPKMAKIQTRTNQPSRNEQKKNNTH